MAFIEKYQILSTNYRPTIYHTNAGVSSYSLIDRFSMGGTTRYFIGSSDMLKYTSQVSNIYQINNNGTIYNLPGTEYILQSATMTSTNKSYDSDWLPTVSKTLWDGTTSYIYQVAGVKVDISWVTDRINFISGTTRKSISSSIYYCTNCYYNLSVYANIVGTFSTNNQSGGSSMPSLMPFNFEIGGIAHPFMRVQFWVSGNACRVSVPGGYTCGVNDARVIVYGTSFIPSQYNLSYTPPTSKYNITLFNVAATRFIYSSYVPYCNMIGNVQNSHFTSGVLFNISSSS